MLLSYANRVFRPGVGVGWDAASGATNLNELGSGRAGALTTFGGAPGGLLVDFGSAPVSVRVAALINVTLPVGSNVTISRRLAGMSGYSYDPVVTQVRELPTGERYVLRVWDEKAEPMASDGVQFFVQGPSGPWSLGEVWVGPALKAGIRSTLEFGIASAGQGQVSTGGQVYIGPIAPRRYARLDIVPQHLNRALVESGGLQTASQALAVDPRCFLVADATKVGTQSEFVADPVVEARQTATGFYGRVTDIGQMKGERKGPYFSQRYQVEEIPGRVPGT